MAAVIRLLLPFALIAGIALLILGPRVLGPWRRARRAGVAIPLSRITQMWFNKMNPNAVVDAYIMSHTAGMSVPLVDLESHAATGGHVQRAVLAAVAAHKAGLDYDHHMAIAADMSGRDAVEEVHELIRARRIRNAELRALPKGVAESLVGTAGTVSSPVSTPGIVLINGKPVSAISKDGPIPKGANVRVVQTNGDIAIVERTSDNQ